MLKPFEKSGALSLLRALTAMMTLVVAVALADPTEDVSVMTALSLNLARFTEWPSAAFANDSKVRLCVTGDNVMQNAFDEIDSMPVGSRKIQVVHLLRLKNFSQCHMLFVNGLDRSTVLQLLNETRNQPILTVSNDDNHFLADSGMVIFKIVDGKVNIEINLNAVKLAGLEINSRVLKLATIVNP